MKKFTLNLIAFMLLVSAFSCDNSTVEADPNLSGTTWSQHNTTDANGRKIYKVLQFTNSVVKIDYRFEKDELYYQVGEFTYIYSSPEFWVKNPDNTISQGSIISSQIRFGGEIFDKRQ